MTIRNARSLCRSKVHACIIKCLCVLCCVCLFLFSALCGVLSGLSGVDIPLLLKGSIVAIEGHDVDVRATLS